MNCNYSRRQCPLAKKNYSIGWVPRAFTPCKSENVKILVIGKNPGHPLVGECNYYKGKKGAALLKAKEQFDLKKIELIRNRNNKSLNYHKNMRRYLRYFLGFSKRLEKFEEYQCSDVSLHDKEIFRHVAITNLFKCSTKCEQQKLKRKDFYSCYKKYFPRELELISPKVILALGGEVSRFLSSVALPVPIVSIKHPSYFYSRNEEPKYLKTIKRKLDRHLIPNKKIQRARD